ncbi:MAG: sugar ABC transporter permease [Clostridia bacterium]|nr:sugar ABC transporter permease [Clostridia bacterium]
MIVASKRERFGYYLFLLPAFIIFGTFIFGPMIYSFYLSFCKYSLVTATSAKWIGLDNYLNLFKNMQFLAAVKNTAIFTVILVPLTLFGGLMVAIGINSKLIKYKRFYKICYYIPYVSSMVAVSYVFKILFSGRPDGVMNALLQSIGLEPIGWLASADWDLIVVILLSFWKQVGYVMIIYLGGLLAIPDDVYEAVSLDPISGTTMLRKITLPLLKPTTMFLLVTEVINSFQIFTPVHVMTSGGPGMATLTLVTLLYEKGFKNSEMGQASAIAVIIFVVLLILSIIQNKVDSKE